jgi:NTE family protein
MAATTRYVGTSAGSTVAAQLASGRALSDLFDAQLAGTARELAVSLDLPGFTAMMTDALAGAGSPEEMRRRIGAIALAADTPSPAARRAVIESRLPSHEWPDRPLQIPAVDTATGELRVFDRSSGVDLVDAVAASCAVPGIWPPVEIDGALYMDGGMRTSANADLAVGAARVLIIVPGPEVSPLGPAITSAESAALAGSRLQVVYADVASLAAIGSNPLDPGTRGPAAHAGRRVGRRAAAAVAALWI